MCKPRNKWLYELKDGNEIVQYGLTNDPDKRQHGGRPPRYNIAKTY